MSGCWRSSARCSADSGVSLRRVAATPGRVEQRTIKGAHEGRQGPLHRGLHKTHVRDRIELGRTSPINHRITMLLNRSNFGSGSSKGQGKRTNTTIEIQQMSTRSWHQSLTNQIHHACSLGQINLEKARRAEAKTHSCKLFMERGSA